MKLRAAGIEVWQGRRRAAEGGPRRAATAAAPRLAAAARLAAAGVATSSGGTAGVSTGAQLTARVDREQNKIETFLCNQWQRWLILPNSTSSKNWWSTS